MRKPIGIECKTSIVLHWRIIELFLQNEEKSNTYESTEHERNSLQIKIWILSFPKDSQSIKTKCGACRKEGEQTITQLTADLNGERLDASTAITKDVVIYFVSLTLKNGRRTKK